MKVLVACEESQAVTIAFRRIGIEAYSCDVLPCSGGHPEYHIQKDVTDILGDGWNLMIAHPPCTFISNAGARFLYPKGQLNLDRYERGKKAADFFMFLYNANIKYICVENPVPSKIFRLPKYSQIIHPWEHGHPYQKRTCLWLKGLPALKPSNVLTISESTKVPGNWFNRGGVDRQKNRSKTFTGIAKAMAEQWGRFVLDRLEEK